MASLAAVLPLPLACLSIMMSAVLQVSPKLLLCQSFSISGIYIDSCNCLDTNCTDALVDAGPWCADPTWVLCNNNGYFCCLSGQTCYKDGNTDGCAYPGQELGRNQQVLQPIHQVPRSIASTTTTSSATSSSATQGPTSGKPSQDNSGGLDTSDKIAIGIGVPVGVATILGAWITWKMYQKKKYKVMS